MLKSFPTRKNSNKRLVQPVAEFESENGVLTMESMFRVVKTKDSQRSRWALLVDTMLDVGLIDREESERKADEQKVKNTLKLAKESLKKKGLKIGN